MVIEVDPEPSSSTAEKFVIPDAAVFLEDLDGFMKEEENVDVALRKLDQQYDKYKTMEIKLLDKRKKLKKELPDIKTSLEILMIMKVKKAYNQEVEAQFLLAGQIFLRASIPATDIVCLWLGAKTMLEFSFEEAEEVFTTKLQDVLRDLDQIDEDIGFLRDQLTTTEINMARVYNWNKLQHQKEREKED